jgi:hypothetical protein
MLKSEKRSGYSPTGESDMSRAVILAGLWLSLASPGFATTLLWMDVQDLTRNSSAVVMGSTVSQSHLTTGPGVPLNQVTFRISRTLKGNLEGTIVVNNPGFPGAPVYVDGDELILFIHSRNNTHVITGFQQGSFKIISDASGSRILDRRIPSLEKSLAGDRSVERLVSEVLDAAQ